MTKQRMKIVFLIGILTSLPMIGFALPPRSLPVSAKVSSNNYVQDVAYRIIGPGGRAIIYFQDPKSKEIILKDCGDNYTIIDKIEDFENCIGKERYIEQETFYQLAKKGFYKLQAAQLNPLTSFDIFSYIRPSGSNSSRAKAELVELEDLLNRIEYYLTLGAGDFAESARLETVKEIESVRQDIKLALNHESAVKIIDAFIQDLVAQIIDVDTLYKAADGTNINDAKYNILSYVFSQVE